MRFDRFFVDSPVCVPSRYSMLTGRHPARTGVYHNDAMWLQDGITPAPPFTRTFTRAGYRVVDFGKAHVPPGLDAFAEVDATGSDQLELMAVADQVEDRVAAPYGGTLAAQWPASMPYTPETLTERVLGFLSTVDDDRPFLCRASYLQPHTPVIVPEPWAGRYRDEDWPVDRPAPPGLSSFEARFGDQGGLRAMSTDQQRSVQSHYHGLVAWLDEQVGRLLDALEASSRRRDAIVVFGADHGALLGELGGGIAKHVFNPAAQRVPFLLSAPDRVEAGDTDDTLAAGVDLGPTLLGPLPGSTRNGISTAVTCSATSRRTRPSPSSATAIRVPGPCRCGTGGPTPTNGAGLSEPAFAPIATASTATRASTARWSPTTIETSSSPTVATIPTRSSISPTTPPTDPRGPS